MTRPRIRNSFAMICPSAHWDSINLCLLPLRLPVRGSGHARGHGHGRKIPSEPRRPHRPVAAPIHTRHRLALPRAPAEARTAEAAPARLAERRVTLAPDRRAALVDAQRDRAV